MRISTILKNCRKPLQTHDIRSPTGSIRSPTRFIRSPTRFGGSPTRLIGRAIGLVRSRLRFGGSQTGLGGSPIRFGGSASRCCGLAASWRKAATRIFASAARDGMTTFSPLGNAKKGWRTSPRELLYNNLQQQWLLTFSLWIAAARRMARRWIARMTTGFALARGLASACLRNLARSRISVCRCLTPDFSGRRTARRRCTEWRRICRCSLLPWSS